MSHHNQSKNISILMRTTALTAVGLIAITGVARADDVTLPVNGQVVSGSSIITNPSVGYLQINQNTDRTVINWDSFNIGESATVQFYQPNSGSLAVNRVVGAGQDPTKILGTLRANGNVMVLDRNGVLFGKNAVVDVGGIVASTGDIDAAAVMNDSSKIILNNVASGKIVNEGTITVSDYGMASFVAPSVQNSGVINAKLGKVALAAGIGSATVDLYGDGLVEFAPAGTSGKVLAENSGKINAEGGVVQLSASAAKNVVDQTVNMSGIINASSATVKGGKIILSASNGKVNVSGKMDANGKLGGGKISVTAHDIESTNTATLSASATESGNGGTIDLIATDTNSFNGALIARGAGANGKGGTAEISGALLGFNGDTDLGADNGELGALLLDPAFAIIHSGVLNILGPNYIMSAQQLANAMKTANVTVQATDFIDVGTKRAGYNMNTGNPAADGILNALLNGLSDGNIDLSTWNKLTFSYPSCLLGCTTTGTTAGSITLQSNTVNFNRDLLVGNGNVAVNAPTINLDGKISGKASGSNVILNATRLSSNSGLVNVISNKALVQQGLDLVAVNGTVDVGAGTYDEDLTIAKNGITLKGKKAGVAGGNAARGVNETILTPHSPGIVITANNATVDGLVIDGASNGIEVLGASNATLKNNIIKNSTDHAIYASGAANALMSNNKIDTTGSHAIHLFGSANARVLNNLIGTIGTNNNINGDGVLVEKSNGAIVKGNTITETTSTAAKIGSGVHILNSSNVVVGGVGAAKNTISKAEWDGVKVTDGSNIVVSGNDIDHVKRVGVFAQGSTDVTVQSNDINDAGLYGVRMMGVTNSLIDGNLIDKVGINGIDIYFSPVSTVSNNVIGYGKDVVINTADDTVIGQDGIAVLYSPSVAVTSNKVAHSLGNGVFAQSGSGVIVQSNTVDFTGRHGVYSLDSSNAKVLNNLIGTIGTNNNINGDGVLVEKSNGAVVKGNTITETTSTSAQIGSGVHILKSGNVVVGGVGADKNTISKAEWDGVKVTDGYNVTVTGNKIDDVVRVGVYSTGTNGLTISSNDIDGAGLYGIRINSLSGATVIDSNIVDNVTSFDGVSVVNTVNTQVKSNVIGYGVDGVLNTVDDTNIGRDGVSIVNASGALVDLNKVAHAGRYGIFVDPSPSTIVSSNTVDFTENHGVYVLDSSNTQVLNNLIGTNGGYNNIGGDGVLVEYAQNATVNGNTVSNAENDGIQLRAVNGTATVNRNTVTNSGNNGVEVEGQGYTKDLSMFDFFGPSFFDLEIANNVIGNSMYNGIVLDNLDGNIRVIDNEITNSRYENGVAAYNVNTQYYGPYIPNDGPEVFRFVSEEEIVPTQQLLISNNYIENSGNDGVYLYNVGGDVTISGNEIYNSYNDGVNVYNYSGYYGGDDLFLSRSYYSESQPINLTIADNIIENSEGVIVDEESMSAKIANYGVDGYAGIELDISADGYAKISGNTIGQNFEYGLLAYSGLLDLTGKTNTIHDTNIGMRFYARGNMKPFEVFSEDVVEEAPVVDYGYLANLLRLVGDTIGTTEFIDQTNLFVDLGVGTFFAPGTPTLMNGNDATYTLGGTTINPTDDGTVTASELATLESMFYHYNDVADRGLFFFHTAPQGFDEKDVFRSFNPLSIQDPSGNLIITGLPRIGGNAGNAGGAGPTNFNDITPAAGGEEDQQDAGVAAQDIEPAAGGEADNAACWADANQTLGGGGAVQMNLGGGTGDLLNDAAKCGTQASNI